MASVTVDLERREERRRPGGTVRWHSHAVLRPGQHVTIINITSRGALVESDARLRPGANTEMQLAGPQTRTSVKVKLDRCWVTALDPLRYRGVVLFESRVVLDDE